MTRKEDFSTDLYREPVSAPLLGFRAFMVDNSPWRSATTTPAPTQLADDAPAPTEGAFGIVGRGLLRSVFMSGYRWGIERNTATCMAGSKTDEQEVEHADLLAPSCLCGLWAYTGGAHDLTVPGPAAFGIVEGWGRMVVGPNGFRAERARIRAIMFPTPADVDGLDEEPDVTVWPSGGSAAVAKAGHVLGTALTQMGNAIAQLGDNDATQKPLPPKPTPSQQMREAVTANAELRAAVRLRYPNLPVFDRLAAMFDEFPLSSTESMLTPKEDDDAE